MENYKLAFIYGMTDEKRNIREGEIEFLGNMGDSNELHIGCLLDYAQDRYPDIGIFQQLNRRHTPETVGSIFTLFGHILFLNTTKNIQKYGKTGLFLMPQEITDIQRESLYDFAKTIEDFYVFILYDLHLDSGILEGEELRPIKQESPVKMLDVYFKKKNIKNTIK